MRGESVMKVLGIIGGGKLGRAIARAALTSGWTVLVYDLAPVPELFSLVDGNESAKLVDGPELAQHSDVILLAVPFEASAELDWSLFTDRIVLDAMNQWSTIGETEHAPAISTTASVQARNPQMRLVKSLNHFSYHDYRDDKRALDVAAHRAMAVISDDIEAAAVVAGLVRDIGYAPVIAGMDCAHLLDPKGPVFGADVDEPGMRVLLGATRNH